MEVLDYKYAKKFTNDKVKTTLKRGKKGVSIFATKPIKKGNVVAYYRFMVYKDKKHRFVKSRMYAMTVYTKKENASSTLMGDVYKGSMREPKHNIPFWGYFSNEPSKRQSSNAFLDINTKSNYKYRNTVKAGDIMFYKLVASRDIKVGEEICWCYGDYYDRDYESSCQPKDEE